MIRLYDDKMIWKIGMLIRLYVDTIICITVSPYYRITAVVLLLITVSPYQHITCLYAGEPATITGDKMKILSKGDVMEFMGNVKFVQGNLKITSDRMKSNEKTGIVSAQDNIFIQYSSGSTNTYAFANKAEYNKNTGTGIVNDDVRVKRFLSENTTDVVNLNCQELEIFDFGEKFHAIKNVKIFQNRLETLSDEAFYDHKTNEILLLGGPPKIIKTEENGLSEFSGDKIFLEVDKETITILGNVQTKMILK